MNRRGTCSIGIVLILLLLAGALLPALVSTPAITYLVASAIGKRADSSINIDQISLSWSGPQIVKGLRLTTENGCQLSLDTLTLFSPLWKLGLLRNDLGQVELVGLDLSLSRNNRSSHSEGLAPPLRKGGLITGHFLLLDGHLTLEEMGPFPQQEIAVERLSLVSVQTPSMTTPDRFTLEIEARGRTQIAEQSGRFASDLTLSVTPSDLIPACKGYFECSSFPVASLDHVISLFCPAWGASLTESLGSQLNFRIEGHATTSRHEQLLDLHAQAPHLQFDLSLARENRIDSIWRLAAPAYLEARIGPMLSRAIRPLLLPNYLIEADRLMMNVQEALFKLTPSSPSLIQGSGACEFNGLILTSWEEVPHVTPILWEHAEVAYHLFPPHDSSQLQTGPRLQCSASMTADRTLPSIHLNLTTHLPTKSTPWWRSINSISLKLDHFPLSTIDALMQLPITRYLGPSLDGELTYNPNQFLCHLNSQKLRLDHSLFIHDEQQWKFKNGGAFRYQLPSQSWLSIAPLSGSIKHLEFMPGDEHPSVGRLLLSLEQAELFLPASLGSRTLSPLNVQIERNHLDQFVLSIDGEGAFLQQHQQIPFTLTATRPTCLDDCATQFALRVGPQAELATLKGVWYSHALTIDPDSSLNVEIDSFRTLFPQSALLSDLVQTPLTLSLQFNKLFLPLASPRPTFNMMSCDVKGTLSPLILHMPTGLDPLHLQTVDFAVKQEYAERSLAVKSQVLASGKPHIQFHFKDKIELPATSPDRLTLQLTLADCPLSTLPHPTRLRGVPLTQLIGKDLTLSLEGNSSWQAGECTIDLHSPLLHVEGRCAFNNRAISCLHTHPLSLTYQIDATNYDSLMQVITGSQTRTPLSQIARSKLACSFTALNYPFASIPLTHKLTELHFKAQLHLDHLLLPPFEDRTELTSLRLDCEKNEGTQAHMLIESGFHDQDGRGLLSGRGSCSAPLSPDHLFDPLNLQLSLLLSCTHLPSTFADLFTQLSSRSSPPLLPSDLLGKRFNADLHFELQDRSGKCEAKIRSEHANLDLVGQITDGHLRLTEPLMTTLTLSPQLNRRLTQRYGLSVIGQSQATTLYISPQDFEIPLASMATSSFPDGKLEIGELFFKIKKRSPSALHALLDMPTQTSSSLWFTPTPFSLKRGTLYLDRTDLLYDRAYRFAYWGTIDLSQRAVALMLGVLGETLEKVGRIDKIDPNYVLKIPIEGPFGQVTIHQGSAMRQLALLLGTRQLPKQGGWLGGLMHGLGRAFQDQSDIPPAHPPFPWD